MYDRVRATGPEGPIVATYSGNTDFTGSASSGFTENVSLGHATTTPSVAPSAVASGAVGDLLGHGLGNSADSPTGSVAFTIGDHCLCTRPRYGLRRALVLGDERSPR